MIEIEAPDGTIIEFPEGTDDATIKRVMSGISQPQQKTPIGRAVMQGLGQGVSAGFMDEAVGGINSATGLGASTEAMRGELDRARQDRPVAAYGAEIAGSILPGAAAVRAVQNISKGVPTAAGKIAQWLSTPKSGIGGRMATGAAQGAIGGGIYGAGSDTGGIAERLDGAAVGAGIGAGVGGALPAVVGGLGAVTAPIRNPAMAALGIGNAGRANRAISTGLERSGMSMDDVTNATTRAAAEGQPDYVLADALGNPGQRMLAGQARRPGDMRKEIIDFLQLRQDGQGDRLGAEVANQMAPAPSALPATGQGVAEAIAATRPTETATQVTGRLKGARGALADTQYAAARGGAGPVDVRGALGVIDDRIGGMEGSGIAGDSIDARLAGFKRRLAAPEKALDAGETARELSDFDRVLGVKQDVQDARGAALRAGRNNEARFLRDLERQLDEALEASSEGYRVANDTFRQGSGIIDAVEAGQDLTAPRNRASDSLDTLAGMTAPQRQAAAVGYGDRLLGKMENAAPGVNKARDLTRPKVAQELGALANDPERLNRVVGRESTMFETARQAVGGSQTADNLADMEEASGFDASAIANLLTGNFRTGSEQLLQAATQAAKGQNEETRRIITQALLSRDPEAVLKKALSQTGTDASNRAIIDALLRNAVSRPTINNLQ